MSSDTKPSMPAQPATVELEKPPAWAIALMERVETGFRSQRVDSSLLQSDVTVIKDRIATLETRVKHVEERQDRGSDRVRKESDVNLKQDAALAEVLVTQKAHGEKLAALTVAQDEQLSILKRLDAVAANPLVRRIAYAVATALLTYLAAKGWVTK